MRDTSTYRAQRRNDARDTGANNQGSEIIRSGCGTSCCIGGWVALHMDPSADDKKVSGYVSQYIDKMEHPLFKLYWQNCSHSTTPKDGAEAIRNFLTTGEPNWDRAYLGYDVEQS